MVILGAPLDVEGSAEKIDPDLSLTAIGQDRRYRGRAGACAAGVGFATPTLPDAEAEMVCGGVPDHFDKFDIDAIGEHGVRFQDGSQFVNGRGFRHGIDCVRGIYSDPNEAGEILKEKIKERYGKQSR